MGLFSFSKGVGKKLFGNEEAEGQEANEAKTAATAVKARKLADYLEQLGIEIEDLEIRLDGDAVSISGKAPNQETKEKAILAIGNVEGVAEVEDNIMVDVDEPVARYYTVKSGDNLSKIAKAQ